MRIDKIEIKQHVLRDIGCKLDEQHESLQKGAEQLTGGRIALVKMAAELQKLAAIADQELETGDIPDLQALKHIKTYITRAVTATEGQARHLEMQELHTRGKVEQAERSVKMVEKLYTDEENRLRAILAAIDEGEAKIDEDGHVEQSDSGEQRIPGTRPKQSLKERRNAEEKAEAKVEVKSEVVLDTTTPTKRKTKTQSKSVRKAK